MMNHDQLFKDLFKARFGDLVEIVLPKLAPRFVVSEVDFSEQEVFADMPQGTRNEVDILAKVPTDNADTELVLVHVEIEGEASSSMGARLMRYNMQLELRHDRPVVPVVVYLHGGKPNVRMELWSRQVLGHPIWDFHYVAFGLSPSVAEEYLARPEPLAWALAALMKSRAWTSSRQKLECLKRIAAAELPETHRFLLFNCVESYLTLEEETERQEYERLIQQADNKEVHDMERTWAEKVEEQGIKKGMQQGIQTGVRQTLVHLLEQRFGPLPEPTRHRVDAIESVEELNQLVSRVLSARTLDEMGLRQ